MASNPHIEIIARAVITCGDHALVCRHPPGKYLVFPGGHVEFGEPAARALARELLEELGLELPVGPCLGVQEQLFEQKGRARHEYTLMFHVEHPPGWDPASPPSLESPEAPKLELIWIHRRELAGVQLLPSLARTVLETRFAAAAPPQPGSVAWAPAPNMP